MAIVWETTRLAIEGFLTESKASGVEYTPKQFNDILEQIYTTTVGTVATDPFGNPLLPKKYNLSSMITSNVSGEINNAVISKVKSANDFIQSARNALSKLTAIKLDYNALLKIIYYEIKKEIPDVDENKLYTFINDNLNSTGILQFADDPDAFIENIISKSSAAFGTSRVGIKVVKQIYKQSIVTNMATHIRKIQEYKTKYLNLITGVQSDILNSFQNTDTHVMLNIPGLISLKVYKPHYSEYEQMLTDALIRLATPMLPIEAATQAIAMIESTLKMIETIKEEYTYEKLLAKYTEVVFKTVNVYIDSLPKIDLSEYINIIRGIQSDINDIAKSITTKYNDEISALNGKIYSIDTDDIQPVTDIMGVIQSISSLTNIVSFISDLPMLITALFQTGIETISNSEEINYFKNKIDRLYETVAKVESEINRYIDALKGILSIQDKILDEIKKKIQQQLKYASDMITSMKNDSIYNLQLFIFNGIVNGLNTTWSAGNVECIFTNTMGGVPVRNVITKSSFPLVMNINASDCNFVDETMKAFQTHASLITGVYYVMVGSPPVLTPFPWTGLI